MIDSSKDYELLDFGEGRKLERFGTVVLDRPCPAAEGNRKASPGLWSQATAHYEQTRGDDGVWAPSRALLEEWTIGFALNCDKSCNQSLAISLRLHASPFGHVGVFPEQHDN